MLELYHAGLTACSKKARLCLREKGLDYVSHYVELGKFEQHDPEYLKLNPNGLVPTLVHDGGARARGGRHRQRPGDTEPIEVGPIDGPIPDAGSRPREPGNVLPCATAENMSGAVVCGVCAGLRWSEPDNQNSP